MARSRSGLSSNVRAEDEARTILERVFREEAGRLTASLVRLLGDFDLAEELVSDAVVEALEHWGALIASGVLLSVVFRRVGGRPEPSV